MYPEIVVELRSLAKHIVSLSDLSEPVYNYLKKPSFKRPPVIVAFGKGSCSMAKGALNRLERVEGGTVVILEGSKCSLPGLEIVESTHPIPSDKSLHAAETVIEWIRRAGDSPVIVLVSGGGSAMVEKPLPGVELEDIAHATKVLLNAGLSILEINTVRKHLSLVKGGRLATYASGKVYGLYASDVPGDRLDLIASGPTVPDLTTFSDALDIITKNGLTDMMPTRVLEALERGMRGEIPETPKPGDPLFERVYNQLVAANINVLKGLQRKLEEAGYNTIILTSRIEGESREASKVLSSIALEILERGIPVEPPAALLVGGETAVTVAGEGRGGRNMELALSFALRLDYWRPDLPHGTIRILAMDTDGIDGNTPSAGAIAFNGIREVCRERRLDPMDYLLRNDTYSLFSRLGLTIDTGPTGSNLNSVAVILIGSPG